MGLFGGGDDTARDIENQRRADEEQRRQRIAAGSIDVNNAFARLLNPNLPTVSGGASSSYNNAIAEIARQGGTSVEDVRSNPLYVDLIKLRTQDSAVGQTQYAPDYENSPFLESLERSYLDFATPEVGRQARKATEKSTNQLARRGTMESSIAAEQQAEIARQQAEALGRVAARASEIRSQRAREIESSRQNVIAQLEASGNSAAAAQSALNASQTLAGSQEFSPLANLFNTGLSTGSDILQLQSQPGASPTIFSRGSKGSQKVIS